MRSAAHSVKCMSSSSDARKERRAEAAKAKRAKDALAEGREPGKRSGRKRKEPAVPELQSDLEPESEPEVPTYEVKGVEAIFFIEEY